ncbi:DUF4326 domain-containing protein [Dactylosporangium salmoneum]|uniref:DUF4326 domain-containing protein n=1 Tax=Dactylosporangium salmoneum TaxID=53361 RepID=A0ABN3G8X4_9ACTN
MPARIQRRRARGWRMPEGAIYVGRPTGYGNPYRVGTPLPGYRAATDAAHAVELYRALVASSPAFQAMARRDLAGRDLVCWCRESDPCHADVLLRIAAGGEP